MPRVAKHPSVQGLLHAVQHLKDARGRRSTNLALTAASAAFTEARSQQQINPRLTTMLLKEYTNRGAREHAETLWRTMRRGEDPCLTPQLATALISSFGSLGAWHQTHEVLRAARAGALANTIVYNSFLHACSRRAKPGGATGDRADRVTAAVASEAQSQAQHQAHNKAAAAKSARAALHRMRLDGVAADAHSTALAISVFGRAGELEAARRLLAEAEPTAVDLVAYNSLIHAAAASADAELALSLLDGMEQAGLHADLHAFNGVLHSLVGAQRVQRVHPSKQQALDLIGKAGEIRIAMAAAGVEEDEVTRTSLLALYSDSKLAEDLLGERSAWHGEWQLQSRDRPLSPSAAAATASEAAGKAAASGAVAAGSEAAATVSGHTVLDLRGHTVPSAVIALRAALQRAADAHTRGQAARGWLIVCSGAVREQGREHQRHRAPPPPVRTPLHRTTRDFLLEHGIRFHERRDAGLRIVPSDLDKAAARIVKARLRHWILQTGLARFTMATSLVSLCWIGPQIFMIGNVPGG